MASRTTGQMVTVAVLDDPIGMRPSDKRYWEGHISEHTLNDGRVVWATWLPYSKTHVHITVWDENEVWTVEGVCRLQAAQETEKLFKALEI
jgi:hypothetical protein